jgi:predicted phage terminase large subunit-like protein
LQKAKEKLAKGISNISKISPAEFAEIISGGFWKKAKHLEFLDEQLQRLINREFRGLIVNMPPRHGKSEFISMYFPAWHLWRYPDKRIILTTYSNQFAAIWGRRVKELIEGNREQLGMELKQDARSAASFEIAGFRGGMHSAGAGSSITGRGADLLIVDDPVKNSMDAQSSVKRDSMWDWFNSTAMTRLEPLGVAVLLMTRWHKDDLCGRMLEKYNVVELQDFAFSGQKRKVWIHLSIPAIALQGDILGRQPGEALWPERYDLEELLNKKKNLGASWFEAMFQQNPLTSEDSPFKRKDFRYFTEEGDYYILGGDTHRENAVFKNDCVVRASVDLAVKAKESSDYTAAIVFAITPAHQILILEVLRLKITGLEQIRMFEHIQAKWSPQFIGVESVQFQTALIYQLMDMGFSIKPLKPFADKRMRAQGISLRLANGRVYFRTKAAWLNDFEKELLEFPHSKHDDQADAFAYIDNLIGKNVEIIPVGRKKIKGITRGF